MANIYEVAKRAGVSTATVSRVLSQPNVVSPDTRHKVMQAVEFLDYAPNSAAKNLRTLRTGKLLVTVPDISNPFFALILQIVDHFVLISQLPPPFVSSFTTLSPAMASKH